MTFEFGKPVHGIRPYNFRDDVLNFKPLGRFSQKNDFQNDFQDEVCILKYFNLLSLRFKESLHSKHDRVEYRVQTVTRWLRISVAILNQNRKSGVYVPVAFVNICNFFFKVSGTLL